MILCGAPQYPTDMCPPATMTWRMRVARAIGVRMMDAVSHQPLNGTTFERQRAAGYEKVFNQFRYFVTAVGYEPVIAHADTKTTADPVKHDSGDRSEERRVGKECRSR